MPLSAVHHSMALLRVPMEAAPSHKAQLASNNEDETRNKTGMRIAREREKEHKKIVK